MTHLYEHVSPKARPLLDLLVTPLSIEEIGRQLSIPHGAALTNRVAGLLDALGVERKSGGPGSGWRVGLTRLYFAVDSCWCGHGGSANDRTDVR